MTEFKIVMELMPVLITFVVVVLMIYKLEPIVEALFNAVDKVGKLLKGRK